MRRVGLAFALALCLAGAHVAVARWIAGAAGFPLDDAWIHARLARSLAEGRGFSFNPGEPAAVSSAPLWTLLVSVPAAAAIPFPWAAYLAGAAGATALSLLGFRLAERATGDRKAALLCAALLLGTHPFPWSIASGMEPAFAAALVLATLLAALSGRIGIGFLLASAAGLARPELCLMPGFVLLDALCRLRWPGPQRIARLSLAALAATAAPFLIDRFLTGKYVSAALAAKVGRHGVIAAFGEGRADLVPSILAANLPLYLVPLLRALARDNVALLVLAPIGLWRLAASRRGSHLAWMVFILLPIAVAVLAPFGGPEFHEQRYIGPVVAIMVVAGCVAWAAIPTAPPAQGLRLAALVLVAALSAWSGAAGLLRYAHEVKDINEMQVKIGRWLLERPGGPGTIATNDIGAIGFVTGVPILDLTGLATPEVVPYLRRPPSPGSSNRGWNGASESGLLEFLRVRRPDYVAIFPGWYPSRFFREALGQEVFRVDLDDNVICGDRSMIVYRPKWAELEPLPGGGSDR